MTSTVRGQQTGFTLIELLVALALSLVVTIAAVASLLVAKQGFTAVDASSQLRDNARFASDLLQKVVVQSGFLSVTYAADTKENEFSVKGTNPNPEPHISGVDNAMLKIEAGKDPTTDSRGNCATDLGIGCNNNSDILYVRYQSSPAAMDETATDGTMINCAGIAETALPKSKENRLVSIFHISSNAGGEPALSCTYQDPKGVWTTQPIVEGVESFQVLYGVDGFTTSSNVAFTGAQDGVPDKYVRASDMTVNGDPQSAATYNNWRRVRSVRIGLVLRGAANAAPVRAAALSKLCPLGVLDADNAGVCVDESGSERPPMGAESPPKGTAFDDDGRLRMVTTFTVHLRNYQINN